MSIYKIAFYINILIYVYSRCVNNNIEMAHDTFNGIVISGFLALLNDNRR